MAQQNEQNHSFDIVTVSVKRKRGRPRKEDVPGTEPRGRTQRRRRNPPPTTRPGPVGQPVSGILDGVFDAGFFITVRVGNSGPLLRGMVFDSRLCVPISAANDVAPHIKMLKREEIPIPAPIPAEPLQRRGPNVPSPIRNKGVVNDGGQGSALKLKVSESFRQSEATPVMVQVLDSQRQGLTGEPKLDSTSKASQGNETAGEPELDSPSKPSQGNETVGGPEMGYASRTTSGNEAAGKPKLDTTSKASQAGEPKLDRVKQTAPGNEAAGEPIVGCVSQTTPGNEAVGGPKVDWVSQTPMDNETVSELKQGSTYQTPPANETECEHKWGSTSQTSPVIKTVQEPMLKSTSLYRNWTP